MQLPQLGLKSGLYTAVACLALAYVGWPLLYDHFGEGAEITRYAVRQSQEVHRECQQVNHFLIVPWRLAIEDTERAGHLKIGYWFICSGRIADVTATYNHQGNGWIADSITVDVASGRYELVTK